MHSRVQDKVSSIESDRVVDGSAGILLHSERQWASRVPSHSQIVLIDTVPRSHQTTSDCVCHWQGRCEVTWPLVLPGKEGIISTKRQIPDNCAEKQMSLSHSILNKVVTIGSSSLTSIICFPLGKLSTTAGLKRQSSSTTASNLGEGDLFKGHT